MRILQIDVKSENQTCLMARAQFLNEIEACKLGGFTILKVIHGYGSHGIGGAIKRELHKEMKLLRAQKQIVDYVPCENWTSNPIERRKYYRFDDELIADKDLHIHNPGVTIVFVSENKN